MIGFFLKKCLFDGWDNLFKIFLYNFILIAVDAGLMSLAFALNSPGFFYLLTVLTIMFTAVYSLGLSGVASKISNNKTPEFKDFRISIKETWLHGVALGFLGIVLLVILLWVIPFYFNMGDIVSRFIGGLLFWLVFVFMLALQWFLPVRTNMEKKFFRSLKKSFILFIDNPAFTFFMFVYSLVLGTISIIFLTLVPGLGGIILAQNNAYKLRMYKYDWMEENPDIPPSKARKSVPWKTLLEKDREIMGRRTLKNLFFPWKD